MGYLLCFVCMYCAVLNDIKYFQTNEYSLLSSSQYGVVYDTCKQCLNFCAIKVNFASYPQCDTHQVAVKITVLKVIRRLNLASSLKPIRLFFDWRLLTTISLFMDDKMASHESTAEVLPPSGVLPSFGTKWIILKVACLGLWFVSLLRFIKPGFWI